MQYKKKIIFLIMVDLSNNIYYKVNTEIIEETN